MARLWHSFLAALLALAAATGTTWADPINDSFGSGSPDILNTVAVPIAGGFNFGLTFAGPIAPPSALAINSISGFIDVDTDRNPATGGTAGYFGTVIVGGQNWINYFIAPNPGVPSLAPPNNTLLNLGAEVFLDLGSEEFHPGFVDVIDTNTNGSLGLAAINFGSSSLSIDVPLAFLTGVGGALNYGVLVGNQSALDITDRAPNGAAPLESIPEPASLALLGVAVAAAGLWRRRRRRP